ncbi:MAG: prolyl oligopeptidase family serine peptidase [Gammaproteobacteria bacterium]|nr:prolyl oligopeptidase family serine peptidase [Gammaproteobacteria bacterium]
MSKKHLLPLLALGATSAMLVACDTGSSGDDETMSETTSSIEYPVSRRGDVVDDYFGTKVADPYRWLEDLDSQETADWVAAQNNVTMPYLRDIAGWDAVNQRLTEAWNYERFSLPVERGGHYFYTRNDGLQDQSVLYVTHGLDPDEKQHVLIDPNQLRDDATISLSAWVPDPTGLWLAWSTSDGGTDWDTWYVRDVETGEDLPDVIKGTKFTSASWLPDGSGFFYSRYPKNAAGEYDDGQKVSVYFHLRGTSQSEDVLVHSSPEGETWDSYGTVTEDGDYLVITYYDGAFTNGVSVIDLKREGHAAEPLLMEWDANYYFLGNDGPVFYFQTTNDAPLARVIAVDVREPDPENWAVVVPEAEETLESAKFVGGYFIASYLRDAYSLVSLYDREGNHVRDVEFPGMGTVSGFGGTEDATETFYKYQSFDRAPTSYRYDLVSGESSVLRESDTKIDASQFELKQVFFTSKDGTRVPMFIVHKKGIKLDGSNPTLLYGYGGFNVSETPYFSITRSVWMEMGGVYALANLRGGGEYGEAWHKAGTKLDKQNVFDDFIAASEFLIDQNYTRPDKLAIMGGSNGGLLVGAVMLQRPDLFGAALPAVGVLDMLRYHLPSKNARAWSTDYGLSENEDEFRAQLAYSPVHNVEPGTCYPATLITTADHDDRVVPWHSFKFAAALQHGQAEDCNEPVLIRVETRAGHAAGTPTSKSIEKYTDQWTFLVKALDMEIPE